MSRCKHVAPQEQPAPVFQRFQTFETFYGMDKAKHSNYSWQIKSYTHDFHPHLAQTPHESSIDSHQLLPVHPIRLVQDDPDLVIEPARNIDINVHKLTPRTLISTCRVLRWPDVARRWCRACARQRGREQGRLWRRTTPAPPRSCTLWGLKDNGHRISLLSTYHSFASLLPGCLGCQSTWSHLMCV